MTIVEFLTAQLAEDKKAAHGLMFACRDPRREPVFDWCGGPAAEHFWGHFDAARMLREVEAGEALLASLAKAQAAFDRTLPGDYHRHAGVLAAWNTAARQRAAVYRGRPGYQQEWAA